MGGPITVVLRPTKRINELSDFNNYIDSCVMCGLLRLLHKGERCRRSNPVDLEKECQVWKEFWG